MEKKNQSIGFSLKRISTEQFAILTESFQEGKPLELSVNLRFGADKETRMVGSYANFKFGLEHQPFLLIEVGCHFEIELDAWEKMCSEDGQTMNFAKGFMAHLAMITVGTARGVLHAKTDNTPFNRFVLPTINVTDLVQEDIRFE
jgi:hypothetical protein